MSEWLWRKQASGLTWEVGRNDVVKIYIWAMAGEMKARSKKDSMILGFLV